MKPKDKAAELVEKFKPFVYCYSGSGMLTNTADDNVIKRISKECAIICVDEIDRIFVKTTPEDNPYEYLFQLEYWQEVKKEITNL